MVIARLVRSIVLKKMILRTELCNKISEIHYQNTKNYENTKLIGINNLSKVAFIW
jgi:hypothetical protein